jgi:hypothetical protein
MNVGMLWYDNDPRTALTVKIDRAADYYHKKYGLAPDLCLVHPSMLAGPRPNLVDGLILSAGEGLVLPAPVPQAQVSDSEGHAGKVVVRPNRIIQPGHLWIGKEEKN